MNYQIKDFKLYLAQSKHFISTSFFISNIYAVNFEYIV